MKRRLFALALALLLAVSLPVSALAGEWFIDDGDIIINATENGQTVKQGNKDAVDDDAPVIKQRNGSTATDKTIKIETTGDAAANVTIEDVNIRSDGDAIDVGSSSANITLKGDNKIFSENSSALHVSSGDVTIDGDGSLEARIQDDTGNGYNHNAKIGSHEDENMSGTIHITGDATVTTDDNTAQVCGGDGAGIGSGEDGNMSGTIIIDGNAHVEASSNDRGAGIGSGDDGSVSGEIIIGGSAYVSAIGAENSAGIGTGDDGDFTGSITIDGNANVTAKAGGDHNGYDGSGIGTGDDGAFAGTVTIGGNATVVAAGSDEGCGIGSSDDEDMTGTIIIRDNAKVTAYGGEEGAAIGAEDTGDLKGTIIIVGNAIVNTGVVDDEGNILPDRIGYIGDGQNSNHASTNGHYVIGSDVTINGISGSNIDELKQYVNMRLSGEDHDGDPENLTRLDIRSENGKFTVDASGEGTVEKILYGGSETVPTAPGTYPVTCVVRLGDETLTFQIGTFIVPEPPAKAAQPAPVYHVTDKDGNQIPYTAAREGGVLTIRVDAAYARLTLTADEAQALTAQGVEKVVFITTGATSAFRPADLTAYASEAPFVLTHDGETVTFTAGETDLASLLLQA